MKPASLFAVAVLSVASVIPAQAELFRPETVRGAVLGGAVGAVVGHNHGGRTWEGAAYGALAGGVIGSVVGEARDRSDYRGGRSYRRYDGYRSYGYGPRWSVGIGYHSGYPGYRRHYGDWRHRRSHWHSPSWAWHTSGWHRDPWVRPLYRSSRWSTPSYAARGALWGGLAGAVIGHNNGRHGWEGAAYGLTGGYILGTLADARAEQAAAERAAEAAWENAAIARPAAVQAPITIINNNYYSSGPATPMAAANRAFGR